MMFLGIRQKVVGSEVSLYIQIQQAYEEARIWNELNNVPENDSIGIGLLEENERWEPPIHGFAKCSNIHANWRNAKLHSGGAFIIRDASGNVLHHVKDVSAR
ncbi:hypothetical protein F2Q69_00054988 [Brassica cretica]|uniref:RNase H type-1 domain-containing protein n=1 Tax=Brassica cretica TaxID=69181 RepID=A0A8S9N8M4_BRACR|nr:hypothetical protein F2Q69_00054988 [Brassica cretica]